MCVDVNMSMCVFRWQLYFQVASAIASIAVMNRSCGFLVNGGGGGLLVCFVSHVVPSIVVSIAVAGEIYCQSFNPALMHEQNSSPLMTF